MRLILTTLCLFLLAGSIAAQTGKTAAVESELDRAAALAESAGDLPAAIGIYQRVVERAESTPEQRARAWLGIGRAHAQLGDAEKSADALQRAAAGAGPAAEEAKGLLSGEAAGGERLRAQVAELVGLAMQGGDAGHWALENLRWIGAAAVPQMAAALEGASNDLLEVERMAATLLDIDGEAVVAFVRRTYAGNDLLLQRLLLTKWLESRRAPSVAIAQAFAAALGTAEPEERYAYAERVARHAVTEWDMKNIPGDFDALVSEWLDSYGSGEVRCWLEGVQFLLRRGEIPHLLRWMREGPAATPQTVARVRLLWWALRHNVDPALLDGPLLAALLAAPELEARERYEVVVIAIDRGLDISEQLDATLALPLEWVECLPMGPRRAVTPPKSLPSWFLGVDGGPPPRWEPRVRDATIRAAFRSPAGSMNNWRSTWWSLDDALSNRQIDGSTLAELAAVATDHSDRALSLEWTTALLGNAQLDPSAREELWRRASNRPDLLAACIAEAPERLSLAELDRHLASADPAVRRAALHAIQETRSPEEATTRLRAGLADLDASVRLGAFHGLRKTIGDAAVADLAPLADDPDVQVRRALIEFVDSRTDPTSHEILSRLLLDSDEHIEKWARAALERLEEYHRHRAHLASWREGGDGLSPREALERQAREGKTAEIRILALEGLGTLGDPEALPFLIERVADEDAAIQQAARTAFRELQETIRRRKPAAEETIPGASEPRKGG